ncbi:MAG: NAD(P)H-dependent oxidoreductase [Pseudomonadaceae bacterium]|jgi:NAD(P)H-dependent FMN reductase|nr:NAD(P)H-dependent oxidoreductase [Pseudomonadaceae bacterium]
MLNFVLVAGSSRNNSQSGKVARFMRQRLIELGHSSEDLCTVLDLGQAPLPLWPSTDNGPWAQYAVRLQAADAVVILAPEWNGMACPAIKNFFVYASKTELAHKPGLLVGVSSGIGGGYPISELRASSYKNCRLCYIPEQLIVRNVEQQLNQPIASEVDDQRLRARIDYALDVLQKYSAALKPLRTSIDLSLPEFANGM